MTASTCACDGCRNTATRSTPAGTACLQRSGSADRQVARRRLVEDETDRIGPGGSRGLDVGGGAHAADLDPELRHGTLLHARRPASISSRRRARGIRVLHQAGSDQRQPVTERRHGRGIARALDTAFRDRGPARGELVAQHTEPPRVDRERLEVAAVEPHQHLLGAAAALRGDLRRHLEIAGVERLEQHEETELGGAVEHLDQPRALDHAAGSGARPTRRARAPRAAGTDRPGNPCASPGRRAAARVSAARRRCSRLPSKRVGSVSTETAAAPPCA